MIAETIWARREEHRQLQALRQRLAQETPQAGETPTGKLGRPGDGILGVIGPSAFLSDFFAEGGR